MKASDEAMTAATMMTMMPPSQPGWPNSAEAMRNGPTKTSIGIATEAWTATALAANTRGGGTGADSSRVEIGRDRGSASAHRRRPPTAAAAPARQTPPIHSRAPPAARDRHCAPPRPAGRRRPSAPAAPARSAGCAPPPSRGHRAAPSAVRGAPASRAGHRSRAQRCSRPHAAPASARNMSSSVAASPAPCWLASRSSASVPSATSRPRG